jgi:hypothetical protein
MSVLIDFAHYLSDSETGVQIRESQYLYPLIEGSHLLGLAVSSGLIVLTDLRLLGVFLKHVPVADILHQLRFWVVLGFISTFLTGALLFWAEAASMIENPAFLIKILFVFLGCSNALWFELRWGRRVHEWGEQAILPAAVRYAGWASLSLWTIVIISSRFIPYLSPSPT